jgi:hypothetical protein
MSSVRKGDSDRMIVERLFARLFVAAGGVFWISAVFGADYGYRGMTPLVSARNALLPLILTLVILGIGWFWEKVAAAILVLGAVGVFVWGAMMGWEPGVWSLVIATLAAPMLIAALLYWFAARMQSVLAKEAEDAAAASAADARATASADAG